MIYYIESHIYGQTNSDRWRKFKTGNLEELQAWLNERKNVTPKQPYRLVGPDGTVIDEIN